MPYLWLTGLSADRTRRRLARDANVERVAVIDDVENLILVRVWWTDRRHAFLETLVAVEATCVDGVVRDATWHLELRFRSRESLSDFYQECLDRDVTLDVSGIYDRDGRGRSGVSATLSDRQYETLRTAFETGYFAITREITLEELGDRLGISDTAASQRIRRGLRRLLAEELASSR